MPFESSKGFVRRRADTHPSRINPTRPVRAGIGGRPRADGRRFVVRAAAALLLAAAPTAVAARGTAASGAEPWRDTAKPAAERAAALTRAMTREEKLAYVHGLFPPLTNPKPADMIPSAGYVPGVPRLGIPTLRESDAGLGVANQIEQRKGDTATALPASLALAASFDPELAYAGGAMIGAEARAKTFNVLLAGGVNLTRDAWNGRNFEYLGEDPLLAGVMAGRSIAGVQSNAIVSTIKHYALNSQETGRHLLDARIDETALRESDLLAFEIALADGKPGSVMCAYNRVNGDYACENKYLLSDVLRGEWRYLGFVMSDWGAVHSVEKAALAGLDQQSGQELDSQIFFGAPLDAALSAGRVPEARLDEMVTRILTGVIASGLYDRPTPATAQPIDYAAHAEVAQRVAEAGMVLLKNDRGVLPLARTARRIVLIGGHSDVGVLSGGGSSQVRSVGGAPVEIALTEGDAMTFARTTWHASSPLRAIRALAPGAQVSYVDGADPAAAAAAARNADIAVVFATQWQTEAQDAPSLALPEGQDALIAAVASANPNSVVVLETGGPVLMPWLSQVPAVIAAWYPGQRGGEAIARTLFGEVNPSGRLPISFPRTAAQLPRPAPVLAKGEAYTVDYLEGANVGYRWYALKGDKPLLPFGYGLSYTRFGYAGATFAGGAAPSATVTVRNDGARAGVALTQLYVTGPDRSPPRLAGWDRRTLAPGERARVTIAADPRILARWGATGWRTPDGAYRLALGTDAEHLVGSGEVRVAGAPTGR